MASLVLTGDTSGQVTIAAPAVAGTNTLTLQAATATSSVNTLATAVASTSGTSIDFTGLPAWVKRITVMFNGVSTNGTSPIVVQIGAGSVTTTGYISYNTRFSGASLLNASATSYFYLTSNINTAADTQQGSMIISLLGANQWVEQSNVASTGYAANQISSGGVTLSGTLDRVRITTVNGTDTFDAGSINILYEG